MAEAISAGEETVGELCRQLPGGDPEQASLPAAPSGHHQLRMLEAAVAPARLDDTTISTDPPLGGPAGLWMKWPPSRGQLWPSLPGPEASGTCSLRALCCPSALVFHSTALLQRRPQHD